MDGICTVCGRIFPDISKNKCDSCESKLFEESNDEEQGHWIETNSGLSFYLLTPKIEKIDIYDIAHSLSMLCRFNGHCTSFYSVAQHSLLCALEAKARGLSKKIQLRALIHDAQEAYISDIPRPVKACLPEIKEIEDRIQKKIYQKFGLYWDDKEANKLINEIDNDILSYEAHRFMPSKGKTWANYDPNKLQISYEDREKVISMHTAMLLTKRQFLDLFSVLYAADKEPDEKYSAI